jgi:hypothetical protein
MVVKRKAPIELWVNKKVLDAQIKEDPGALFHLEYDGHLLNQKNGSILSATKPLDTTGWILLREVDFGQDIKSH